MLPCAACNNRFISSSVSVILTIDDPAFRIVQPAAFCVGKLPPIGKIQLFIIGAALLGAIYALVISNWNGTSTHTPLMYALICAVGALISMVGDLAASAIKRNKEIKDYGTLIPGHGGILDRFDSVIFTAPFIYFLSMILL